MIAWWAGVWGLDPSRSDDPTVAIQRAYVPPLVQGNAAGEMSPDGGAVDHEAQRTQLLYETLGLLAIAPTPTLYWTYLDRKSGLDASLKTIVEDLSARVGLTAADLKTAALSDSVIGYVVSDRMSGRAALEPLAAAYLFDAREEDFKVDFVARGGASVVSIAEDDLGARRDDDDATTPLVSEVRTQEIELPRRVDMTYADPDSDYQTGVQSFQRIGEAVARQRDPVRAERVGLDHLGAGVDVVVMHRPDQLGLREVQLVVAARVQNAALVEQ